MGKPGKLKSGSSNKVKKWKKGHSSSSNPEVFKHREKARSKFFHMQPTSKSNKGLTLEALKIHDEMESDSSNIFTKDECGSEGGNTIGTFLSGLSDCTNVTFGKIQRYWSNNSSKHKEVCAVLAAITEVIREQGGQESNTAYFAALVTALSSVEQVDSAAAVAYLLSMTCKNVPVPVLQAKFGEVSKLLTDILSQSICNSDGSAPTSLLKSILSILATLLRHQEKSVWGNASTINTFSAIRSYVINTKPKIRKAAQNAICSILCGSTFMLNCTKTDDAYHPAAPTTAEFCIDSLKKLSGASTEASVCHILSLLGRVLHTFPQLFLKRACEAVLYQMTLSNPVVKVVCLQSLHSMFVNQPPHAVLPPELNAQIINALYDYYPNSSDIQGCPPWLAVMNKALLHLSKDYCNSSYESKAISLALKHIPKLCGTSLKLMLSPSMVVCKAAASTIKLLLNDCTSSFWKTQAVTTEDKSKLVSSVFKLLEDGLKYKYHSAWNLVFQIIEVTFQCIVEPHHINTIKPVLEGMVNLRNTQQFQCRAELDLAVGAAINSLGPKILLQTVPLQIDGTETDYDFPRSWLLPVMKKHITKADLLFFSEYFLPLAAKLCARAKNLKSCGREIEAITYETLQFQCWDLLPVFCKCANDIGEAFPKIARTMGEALSKSKDLQAVVMQSLRSVIITCKKSEKDKAIVAKFAKNFLPILFNLYTDTKASVVQTDETESLTDANKTKSLERLAAIETIRLYLSIADQKLVCWNFSEAQRNVFDGENKSDATRLALLDLLIAMVPHVSENLIENLYEAMKPMLKSVNPSMQKKAYRVLEEVCSSHNEPCCSFVESHLTQLKNLLLTGLSKASQSSKGPRIKCMEQVFLQLRANPTTIAASDEFLQTILPEVILCTKEAKRSRVAAFNLLVNTAKKYIDNAKTSSSVDEIDEEMNATALEKYFQVIFVGLAGSPMMIRATIVALSRLIYEFKDEISDNLLDQTITNVCLLLGCNTREVVKASLGFILVLLHILPRNNLGQYLKSILDALLNWNPSTRRHFRFKVKKILQKLVHKFSFETIYAMTPQEHRKQLQNIQKTERHAKKIIAEKKLSKKDTVENDGESEQSFKKQEKETMDEILADSSESEDEITDNTKDKSKSKGKAWLQDAQEEPLDLLDPSLSQKVLGVNPKSLIMKTSQSDFKTATDGRLIITDDSMDEDNDDNDTNDVLKSIGIAKKQSERSSENSGKKRKVNEDDDFLTELVGDPSTQNVYQPGGKGIHRDRSADQTGEKFKSKKAGGDMKHKGSHEPYAYVPFDTSVLNKRKRKKLTGQYVGLVKAAKKGAAKGKKVKSKNNRKMKK